MSAPTVPEVDHVALIVEHTATLGRLRTEADEAATARAEHVRALRSVGWTVRAIAEATGLSPARVGQIAQGRAGGERG